eukprot:Sspe_Gene.93582::Locus_66181_Transcript_1_1_Confidence_1.000_Length_846::g.93582::m.93582
MAVCKTARSLHLQQLERLQHLAKYSGEGRVAHRPKFASLQRLPCAAILDEVIAAADTTSHHPVVSIDADRARDRASPSSTKKFGMTASTGHPCPSPAPRKAVVALTPLKAHLIGVNDPVSSTGNNLFHRRMASLKQNLVKRQTEPFSPKPSLRPHRTGRSRWGMRGHKAPQFPPSITSSRPPIPRR